MYNYAEQVDTICFPVLQQYELISESKPLFSCKITREYSCADTAKVKSVTIFAREFIYLITQQYKTTPALLDRLESDFKSSRTFSIQNLKSIWKDRSSDMLLYIIVLIIYIGWMGLWITIWWKIFWALNLKSFKSSWLSIVFGMVGNILSFFLIAYFAAHDPLMDWLMSFGDFYDVVNDLGSLLGID